MSTLTIENLSMRFDLPNGEHVQALEDVSLEIRRASCRERVLRLV